MIYITYNYCYGSPSLALTNVIFGVIKYARLFQNTALEKIPLIDDKNVYISCEHEHCAGSCALHRIMHIVARVYTKHSSKQIVWEHARSLFCLVSTLQASCKMSCNLLLQQNKQLQNMPGQFHQFVVSSRGKYD
jgi:hypothetical protein